MTNFWEDPLGIKPQYNCGWPYDNCAHGEPLSHGNALCTLIKIWAFYLIIVAVISLLITLWFYLVYRYKKDEHPFKHAIKKSWPWWIIVFLLPILVIGFLILCGYITYL